MKPISLKFTAFGPYLKEQLIDFSSLNNAGIFLISGETGSGKTVILDAVTYALYGKSSGGIRGDIYSMRTLNAPDNVNTEVEFVFDVRNKRYKFTRTLKYGRKKLNSSQNVLMINSEGIYEPLFENPKLNDLESTAEKLLGLTYEQFRQVVILPQGQFEKLLTSNSKDKEKILISLFGTEKWGMAAKIVYDEAAEFEKKVKDEKKAIELMLNDNHCESIEDMYKLLGEKQELYLAAKKEQAELEKKLIDERKVFDNEKIIYESFQRMEKSEHDYEQIKKEDSAYEQLKLRLSGSDKAEKIKPLYGAMETALSENNRRISETKSAAETLEHAKSAMQKSAKDEEEHSSKKAEYKTKETRLQSLYSMVEIYARADRLKSELELLKKAVSDAKSELNKTENKSKLLHEELNELEKDNKKLNDENTMLLNKYIMNISGTLAKNLADGKPCPVCGSTHHPLPAELCGEVVTEKMIDDTEKALKKSSKAFDKKKKECVGVDDEFIKKQNELVKLDTDYEKKQTEYETVMQNTDDSIISADELKKQTEILCADIENYTKRTDELEKECKLAQEKLTSANSVMKIAQSEKEKSDEYLKKSEDDFYDALHNGGFDNIELFKAVLLDEKEKAVISQNVTEHYIKKESIFNNFVDLKSALKGQNKPDIKNHENIINELDGKNRNLIAEMTKAESESTRIANDYKSLKERTEKLKKNMQKSDEDMRFAMRLRGDNGIGLQRYVLGIMLNSVTNEANRLLENIHGGRYKLYRTLDSSGLSRIKGLEFCVYDSNCGNKRSVATLSGGEKFLAALSLSIGLSTVVRAQSGGIDMGAMFIDEGFGTLDASSVTDALTVLSVMNRSNATVGIISHVDILKENISTGIEISKTTDGSMLKVKE